MKCAECQSENREGVKFCEHCGAAIELVCPNCGARTLPDRRSCGKCGHRLAEPAPEPMPTELSFDEKLDKILYKSSLQLKKFTEQRHFLRLSEYLLIFVLFGLGVVYLGDFVAIVASRITYPFDIEWMEGGMIGNAIELVKSGSMYKSPSVAYIPYIYMPFYPLVSAAGIAVFGINYWFPRLISVVSTLVCVYVLFRILKKETQNTWSSAACSMLFLATYEISGFWFDIARVDMLYLGLNSLALYGFLYSKSIKGLLVSGLLLSLAFWTKQGAALVIVPLVVYFILNKMWRQPGYLRAFSGLVLFNLAIGAYFLVSSGGYFWYYVGTVPMSHAWIDTGTPEAISQVIGMMPMAIVGTILYVMLVLLLRNRADPGRYNRSLVCVAFILSSFISSLLSWFHVGGYLNVLIPLFYFSILGSCLIPSLVALPANGFFTARHARVLVYSMLVIQVLLLYYNPASPDQQASQFVNAERTEHANRLAHLINDTFEGNVLMPNHNVALLTKQPQDNHYHEMALFDIRRISDNPKLWDRLNRQFDDTYNQAINGSKYQAIILAARLPDLEVGYYEFALTQFGIDPDCLHSITGMSEQPRYIYLSRIHFEYKAVSIRNGGFESGDLDGWHKSGEAFDFQPTYGDNSTSRDRPSNLEGGFWVGTYENRPTIAMVEGSIQGDAPQGELTSEPFIITGNMLCFRIGGGAVPDVGVMLVVEGDVVYDIHPDVSREYMSEISLDISDFVGKSAVIVIYDHSSGSWGHINADSFQQVTLSRKDQDSAGSRLKPPVVETEGVGYLESLIASRSSHISE